MIRKIRRLITKSIIMIVCSFVNLKLHIKDFFMIYIRRLTYSEISLYTGITDPGFVSKRVAIISCHPQKGTEWSIINLLKGLLDNGFLTFVVCNSVSDEYRTKILEHCHYYLERYQLGRDFGGYKHVLFRWGHLFNNTETIILANDSMWYPKSITCAVKNIVDDGEDWSCLFESLHPSPHAQGYFQAFSKSFFNTDEWRTYWTKYKPYSSRSYSIKRGEIGLSKVFNKLGHRPASYYNGTKFINSLLEQFSARNVPERFNLVSGLTFRGDQFTTVQSIVSTLGAKLTFGNPTHTVGLLANYLFEAPVKRDVCYRGTYNYIELLSSLSGFSSDELRLIENDIIRKGLPHSLRGIKKILYLGSVI